MRPTAQPLNAILGTEARVRILRTLSAADAPMSPSEVARLTTLRPDGVRSVLAELAASGVVEMVGGGTRRFAQLRPDHPLATAVGDLFAAEAARVDDHHQRVRRAIGALAMALAYFG